MVFRAHILDKVQSRGAARGEGEGGGHINDCHVFAAVTHFITGEEERERERVEWSISRSSWTDVDVNGRRQTPFGARIPILTDVAAAKSFAESVPYFKQKRP